MATMNGTTFSETLEIDWIPPNIITATMIAIMTLTICGENPKVFSREARN